MREKSSVSSLFCEFVFESKKDCVIKGNHFSRVGFRPVSEVLIIERYSILDLALLASIDKIVRDLGGNVSGTVGFCLDKLKIRRRIMKSKLWIQKALTMCSLAAIVASSSLLGLAGTGKAVGELTVSGNGSAPEGSFVRVNGDPAQSGRSVFDSSNISTPEGITATLNIGKAGKVQLGSGSNFILNSDGSNISGDLMSGTLTVLSSAQPVIVRTLKGASVELNTGETVSAESATKAAQSNSSNDAWIPIVVFAGIVGTVIAIVLITRDDNVTSPVR